MTRTRSGALALALIAPAALGASGGHHGLSTAAFPEVHRAWPTPSPDADAPSGPGTVHSVTGGDGHSYRCTDTPYSLTSTPDKITTFAPNVDVLWPGGLIQGGPLQQGVLSSLPLTERAPLVISIPGLLA